MKISYNWLKKFVPLDKSPEEIEALLTATGLEVEHFEYVESIPGGLRGLIVAEVKTCEAHPNADKLKLCKVDDGSGNVLSIVCGAPNVEAGLKVILAPVGCRIQPLNGEAFEIKIAKIRGELSEGMLCAEDEIGLGESHDGIKILPADAQLGEALSKYYKIESDVIFDIGLTANRGDAASHIGVARELATVLNLELNKSIPTLNLPELKSNLTIHIENPEACPRYCGVVLENVQVKESPEWLKTHLKSIGLKSINNVVDLTNYIMHGYGQPLHAFDYSKIEGEEIHVRLSVAGTKFITLDDQTATLTGKELMIANTKEDMCIAGVYGGKHSGVNESTVKLFLESAYFSPDFVRKAAKQQSINTDSSFRFERGTDPEMCIPALHKAIELLQEIAGATIASQIYDLYPQALEPFDIKLRIARIEHVLGIQIPNQKIEAILTGLGIEITETHEDYYQLKVPRFKGDVSREIDVIEELIRIYGFENIPLQSNLKMSLNYKSEDSLRKCEQKISEILSANGFREIMNNSLSSDKHYTEKEKLVFMSNPLSAELNVLRGSMLYSALESIAYNKNRKLENTRFYEFGRVYQAKEKGFKEKEQLIIIASGNTTDESWESKAKEVDYYFIKSIASKIVEAFKHDTKSLIIESVDKATLNKFGIKDKVFYAVIDWTKLAKPTKLFKLEDIPNFPVVRRDLSLVLDQSVHYEKVKEIISKKGGNKIIRSNVFDLYQGKPLEANQKAMSISIELYDKEKTMNDSEIDPIMETLIQSFESELNAIIRK
jgi:phenylalanyl-tRNA synthetase beta chain